MSPSFTTTLWRFSSLSNVFTLTTIMHAWFLLIGIDLIHHYLNPFTANCENAMTLSVPGVPVSCEKFPHLSQLNFWSTESIFNQFSEFLKTLNALCVCLQYKHPRSIKRVIRSDKPVTLFLLLWSQKCDFGAEPRSRIIATSAVKGLKQLVYYYWTLWVSSFFFPNHKKQWGRSYFQGCIIRFFKNKGPRWGEGARIK
jgi:hypothetical protein